MVSLTTVGGIRMKKYLKKPQLSRSRWGNAIMLMFLLILGAFCVLPFIYAIMQSIKPSEEIFVFPPRFLVKRPTWDNFYSLGQLTKNLWVPFSRYVFNSVFVTLTATVGHVLLASMCAYPLAKFKLPGFNVIFQVIVLSLLFAGEVKAIPSFIVMSGLGFIDTYAALILPPIASSLGLFLMKQFMEQIPGAIIEAARVDGASNMRTWWTIVMPAVRPAWLTLIIFSFQSIWSQEGLEFIHSEALKVMPTILRQVSSSGIARAGESAAAAVIIMSPPIVVFLLTQSNIIETMAYSGIKE